MRLSAWLSIAVGLVLGAAQVLRNLDNWANWPTWMLDEAAALMMIVGGALSLWRGGSRVLVAGWGVGVGLYGSSLVSHVMALRDGLRPEARAMHEHLAMIIGTLLALTILGLAMTLLEKRKAGA
jgi:hypothetical protein